MRWTGLPPEFRTLSIGAKMKYRLYMCKSPELTGEDFLNQNRIL
jgi:hypothetical protein